MVQLGNLDLDETLKWESTMLESIETTDKTEILKKVRTQLFLVSVIKS